MELVEESNSVSHQAESSSDGNSSSRSTIFTETFFQRLLILESKPVEGGDVTILRPKLSSVDLNLKSRGFDPQAFPNFVRSRWNAHLSPGLESGIYTVDLRILDGAFPLEVFEELQVTRSEGFALQVCDTGGDLSFRC